MKVEVIDEYDSVDCSVTKGIQSLVVVILFNVERLDWELKLDLDRRGEREVDSRRSKQWQL